ncbi:MAG: hypothetical protein P9L97_04410 [Candidatus Tenebribacter davisii]|nr:hypothetical protein [Candidatus Tenebribacter davisii]
MKIKEIKRLSAKFVVWSLDVTRGEITFPDGRRKVDFCREAKILCTLHWNIPDSLDQALGILTQLEWFLSLSDKGSKFDDITLPYEMAVDEYYYKDEDDNFIDAEFASEKFINTNEDSLSYINSCYGIGDLILLKNNDEELHLGNNDKIFLKEFKEILIDHEDKFLQIKKVLEFKEEPVVTKRSNDIKDDLIPF